jgi:pimeloyl-ACP methyl ester carboxylesterase
MIRFEISGAGYRIPVTMSGDGERCLVCINAAQQTMAAWRPLLKPFTGDTGYRLALFDFPNQGRSPSVTSALDLNQQADVVHAVATHASPSAPVDVFGVSWGSVVAAAYAARYPSSVRRLMLGSFQVFPSAKLREFSPKCQALIERDAKREIAELFIDTFGGGLTDSFKDAIRAQFVRFSTPELSQLRMQCAEIVSGTDLRQHIDFGRITARILIVNGADDPLISPEDNEATARCLPTAELRVLPSVGHFLHFEQGRVVEEYLAFLRRRSSAFIRIPDAKELRA